MARDIRVNLHIIWVRKLQLWWKHYNQEYLGGALRLPLIELSHGEGALGTWNGKSRRLHLSARHLERDPWLEVMDTLRHEMAHQYVDEVLKARGEPPHGPAFKHACEKLRCRPQATSAPVADAEEDRVLRVLKKVLSLASSPNEHEAHVAVEKARRLLLEYNIDLVELDQERLFSHRCLGAVRTRRSSHELWLAMILQEFFFVEILWTPTYEPALDREGTILQIYGTPANLDMAAYVFHFLSELLERLWADYRSRAGVRDGRERLRYFVGILQGLYTKLQEQEQRISSEQALVWKGDAQLKEYYIYLNPRVRIRRGQGVAETAAYRDGLEEGRHVTIHRPLGERGEGIRGYLNSGPP